MTHDWTPPHLYLSQGKWYAYSEWGEPILGFMTMKESFAYAKAIWERVK